MAPPYLRNKADALSTSMIWRRALFWFHLAHSSCTANTHADIHIHSLSCAKLLSVPPISHITSSLDQQFSTLVKVKICLEGKFWVSFKDIVIQESWGGGRTVYRSIPVSSDRGSSRITRAETLDWIIGTYTIFAVSEMPLSLYLTIKFLVFPKASVTCHLLPLLVKVNCFFLCAPSILSTCHFY